MGFSWWVAELGENDISFRILNDIDDVINGKGWDMETLDVDWCVLFSLGGRYEVWEELRFGKN